MKNGRVKWFNDEKAFGFITSEGQDFFVHKKALRGIDVLIQGQHVTFALKSGSKGEQAADVEVIEVEGNR